MPQQVQMIVYGQSGIGKTVFCGSVVDDPRAMPALMLDVDRSTQSIESRIREVSLDEIGNPVEGKIDTVRVKNWLEFQKAYDFLFSVKAKNAMASYKTLIVDTLSEVHYLCLSHVAEQDTSLRLSPEMPEIQDYGKASVMMKKMLRAFRDIEGLHCFYTCQPKMLTDSVSNITQVKPQFVGQLADEAVAIIPIIGYIKINNQLKREMQFQPTTKILAKDRSEGGKLGQSMVDPTVKKLFDMLGVK